MSTHEETGGADEQHCQKDFDNNENNATRRECREDGVVKGIVDLKQQVEKQASQGRYPNSSHAYVRSGLTSLAA